MGRPSGATRSYHPRCCVPCKGHAIPAERRLKRVFNIDVSNCPQCGVEIKVIACIEGQAVIDKILNHLQAKGALPPPPDLLPATRATPTSDWFV